MNLIENNVLHLLHVLAAIGLVVSTFFAFAAGPAARKKTLMASGIASLLVLLTGVRMWQALYQFSGGWVIVKIVCWLGLSALTGIAFRRRGAAGALAVATAGLTVVALYAVYFRPF